QPGQIRPGVVKNITSYGAFVDLGGTDGLLHITDMSWERVNDPHEVVHVGQQLDVYIVAVDHHQGKVALGLKQKFPSPWLNAEQKYPAGSEQEGEVTSVMNYGVFIKLEPGLHGLVHVSELGRGRSGQPGVVRVGERV